MDRRTFLKAVPAVAVMAAHQCSLGDVVAVQPNSAGNLHPIILPPPEKDGGKSVLASLWERKTNRNISDKELPPQMLSNLLWAAWGVNREKGPRGGIGRTAASAHNLQEIDLYVVLPQGIYLYEAVSHRLMPVAAGDHREKLRNREKGAPQPSMSLIFVVDIARYGKETPQESGLNDPEMQKFCYHVATGLIAGNVHLFAASQGLAARFHNCDKASLTKDLKLRPEQRLIYAQTVGYPA